MGVEPTADPRCLVIVGAGQAGAWIAKTLRSEGFAGRVVLIGEESHLPYERPPLSKSILSGKALAESACLLPSETLAEIDVEHWPTTSVSAIDRITQRVKTSDGRSLRYDRLFLATGARVRRLAEPASGDGGRIHYLRTLDDTARLKASLDISRNLAVVGGGWIGLEVAATAREMGVEVTVLEAAPLPCMRSVPGDVSRFLIELHARNGVQIRTGEQLEDIEVSPEGVKLVTANGILQVDQALVGIGVIPETRLAEEAGLAVDNGIVVDETGQTSDSAIYAAGDVTSQPSQFHGRRIRLESWANAQNQAIVAARAALGQDVRHAEVPWIWSDQYSANIQMLGTPEAAAALHLRGEPLAAGGCWLALSATGQAIGAVAVNAPKDLRVVRKALAGGLTPNLQQWRDLATPAAKIELDHKQAELFKTKFE